MHRLLVLLLACALAAKATAQTPAPDGAPRGAAAPVVQTAPLDAPPPLAPPAPLDESDPTRLPAPAPGVLPEPTTPLPAPSAATPEAPAAVTPAAPAVPPVPHVALILPVDQGPFARAADAVRQGFYAASQVATDARMPPLRVYATAPDESNAPALIRQAAAEGCVAVVGPLTRQGVAAVIAMGDPGVPVLALNTPPGDLRRSPRIVLFGLPLEGEARQAARLAFAQGYRNAITVAADDPLARRVRHAFAEAWTALGGSVALDRVFTPSQDVFPGLRDAVMGSSADVIFLSADAVQARRVRPYLNPLLPTYGVSMLHDPASASYQNVDLSRVHFVDMPWVLQPDHTAVMVYPRPDADLPVHLARLYALGIDAYRLAGLLARGQAGTTLDMDGVTGRLRLGADGVVERELTQAEFDSGVPVIVSSPAP